MAEFKIVISDPKSGKSYQKELKEEAAAVLLGKKLGEQIAGELLDMTGYEFVITGGSDSSGFPMRSDVDGTAKKKILAVSGVGIKNRKRKPNPKKKGYRVMAGMRTRKTVAGNTVHEKTAQINLKVTKQGKESLEPKPEAPAADTTPAEGGAQ